MAGFMDGYRRGVARARAARGTTFPDREERFVEPEPAFDAPANDAAQPVPDFAEPETAMPEHDAEIETHKRMIRELSEFTKQQEARIAELDAMIAPLVAVLLMPGVKTGLLNRFHLDKHPEADETKRAAFGEALRVINEAYEVIGNIHSSN